MTLTIDGAMSSGASIGITTADTNYPVVFSNAYDENYAEYFFADDTANAHVEYNGEKKLQLAAGASARKYNVTVTNDGNGTAGASPSTAEANTEITLTATANTGYHFKEWQVISGGVSITDNKFTMPDGDVEVKAIFEADAPTTYTVTFDVNGHGTAIDSQTVESGKTVNNPGDMYAEGWSFLGWYLKDGTTLSDTAFDFDNTPITGNITLFAKWTKNSGGSGGETPHSHSYSGWKFDSANHWKECSCGDKTQVAAHNFTWVVDKEATATANGSKHEECSVCGYQRPAVEIPATGGTTPVQPSDPTNPTKPAESNPNTGALDNVPKTGDSSHMALWISLMCVGCAGIAGTVLYGRKKKEDAE